VTILKTCGDVHVEIGPDDGAKDQALPGSLLQTGFGLEYGGIPFERGLENVFQSDSVGGACDTNHENRGDES
jgi:hypothetical protein